MAVAPNPQVEAQLKRRREAQRKRGKEFRLRVPRILEPRNIERIYRRELVNRLNLLVEMVEARLLERLEGLLQTGREMLPSRKDGLADDMFTIIQGLKVEFARLFPDSRLRQIAQKQADDVAEHNKKQVGRVLKSTLDIDLFNSEPWLKPQIENFIEQNVGLIKSVDERYFGELQETVFRGARTGKSTKEVAEEIRRRGDVTQSKAELIARDQINKFNGQLSEIRQTELGVTRYRWRTSLDERVRPEHAEREGKIFSWDDPPEDGHPGEPINCRCYAEPILEDILE